ncbi:hypothetical protein, partial [Paenibacillus popilliae]
MKKFCLLALVFLLLVVQGNVVAARDLGQKAQEMTYLDRLDMKHAYKQRLAYPTVENVLVLSQMFDVLPSWVQSELAKGYLLTDIYEGLRERQQGGSYESFMALRYKGAFELKQRQKRVAPVVVAAVRAAPVVVSAARAAAPAIVKTARTASTAAVNATKATVSYVKDVGKSASSYINNVAKSTKEFFTGPSQPAQSTVQVTSSINKSNNLVRNAEKLSK